MNRTHRVVARRERDGPHIHPHQKIIIKSKNGRQEHDGGNINQGWGWLDKQPTAPLLAALAGRVD